MHLKIAVTFELQCLQCPALHIFEFVSTIHKEVSRQLNQVIVGL